MIKEYDIVIVGSGAGGGTVAKRLSHLVKDGVKIALLEAGPNFSQSYFTQREVEMMDLYWHRGAWPIDSAAITLAAGKGVGGSTMVYTGVTFRLPKEVLDDWNISGITAQDLKARFDRLEKEIHVIEPDFELINDNNHLFKKGCDTLNWDVCKIPLNIKNCNQTGFCNLGCTSGAKQGTMVVHIPEAVAAGVDLVPNCEVKNIAPNKIYATVKDCPRGTLDGPWPQGDYEINAKRIVLAAGCPGSSAILLRSRFGRTLPALGRYITIHPALTVYGIYPQKIKNYQGFPKTYYTPQFSKTHGYYLETAFYYPFVTTKHLGLWGKDLKKVMQAYDRLMCILILTHDQASPDNCVKVSSKGEIKIQYKISKKTIQSICHAQIQATRVFLPPDVKQLSCLVQNNRFLRKPKYLTTIWTGLFHQSILFP